MAKKDITTQYSELHNITKKQAVEEIDRFIEYISSQLQVHGEIRLTGFGTFGTRVRVERTGVNPATGEEIVIPSKRVPFFRPSQKLKDSVAK